MRPVVQTHIYQFLCLCCSAEGRFAYIIGCTHKGDHGAVGGLSGIHVQHLNSIYRGNCPHNTVNY